MVEKMLATGIGSLPYLDAREAVSLVREVFPTCPYWPQLPKHEEEGFVTQFLAPLKELGLVLNIRGRNPVFKTGDPAFWDNATAFYEKYLESEDNPAALESFRFPETSARGFYAMLWDLEENGPGKARYLKGQIMGPISAGLQIKGIDEKLSFYDDRLRDIVVKCLQRQAEWQVMTLRRFGLPVIVFVDDAMLAAYGTQEHLALSREDVKSSLDQVFEAIQRSGGIAGVHVCAPSDWSILYESKVSVFNADFYHYFPSLLVDCEGLKTFLERGGTIAWGIVPTSEEAWEETPQSLIDRLKQYVETLGRHGIEEELLFQRSMITPSCGTGTLPQDLAEHVHRLTRQLADALRDKTRF